MSGRAEGLEREGEGGGGGSAEQKGMEARVLIFKCEIFFLSL